MENPTIARTPSEARTEDPELGRLTRLCCAVLLFLMTVLPAISRAQVQEQARPAGSEPTPEPAIPAILAAFDKYEIVGMPEAHGFKGVDDFILSLIRNPAFSKKVNDIGVECGNSLYQSGPGPIHSRRGCAVHGRPESLAKHDTGDVRHVGIL